MFNDFVLRQKRLKPFISITFASYFLLFICFCVLNYQPAHNTDKYDPSYYQAVHVYMGDYGR